MNAADLPAPELADSVLVVAHPDDEILWFGSIADRVGRIVLCFLHDPANPGMAEARIRTIEAHPWRDRIVSLGLNETDTFSRAAWPEPRITKHGLTIVKPATAGIAYRLCFFRLRRKLAPIVRSAANVYTHNPWGEYGHEEHVLVQKAVTSLVRENRKRVWYNNHASNWSEALMQRHFNGSEKRITSAPVDAAMLEQVADVYRENGAWTWFDDVDWADREYFVEGPLDAAAGKDSATPFPVEMLTLPERPQRSVPGFKARMKHFARRLAGR
jgi:hypothetical protein